MDAGNKTHHFDLRHKLTFKLFFIVILCSTVFVGLSIALQLNFHYRMETDRIANNVKFIGKSYLPSIADSLYKLDEPVLRQLLYGVLQLNGIEYCEVSEITGDKKYRVSAGNPESRKDIERKYVLRYQTLGGDYVDVGTLTVVASFEGIRTQIWSQWSLNILINAVQIFITAFIVLFIYQVLVSRHLSDMAAYAQQLSIDNLDPQLVLKRKHARDELGLVVDAINDLRERLKQGIEKREKAEEVLRKYEYIVYQT